VGSTLVAGLHYPRSAGEFGAWFATDADCLDYLEWLRWPEGFVCPDCGHLAGWRMADGRFRCGECDGRTSPTAGTIFDKTRTPLTVWFTACWLFATQKDGISAQSLQRALEIGSYQTAWAMLHRLRSVLIRPGRERLAGRVEVDDTFIGGEEPGLRGGRQKGKKSLVGVAVEVREPKGFGRCRMAILPDASAASLHPFVAGHIEPGATVITDAWQGYSGIEDLGYLRDRRSQRAARARGEDPGSCSQASTGSPRSPGAGCWAPTKDRSARRTCRPTWTSSCSDSTAGTPAAAGSCSTASSSSPRATSRSATETSSSTRSPRLTRRQRRRPGPPAHP
jgi:hypothetical protein